MIHYIYLSNVNNLVVVQHQHEYMAITNNNRILLLQNQLKKGQTSHLVLLTNFLNIEFVCQEIPQGITAFHKRC